MTSAHAPEGVSIRELGAGDVEWALALYAANSYDALTAEQRAAGGFVQGRMDEAALASRIAGGIPGWVGLVDDSPAALLLAAEPADFTDGPAGGAVRAARGAGVEDFFLYGPALVDEAARGRGVMRALSSHAFEWAHGRYRWAVAFIEDSNAVSARVHGALGFSPVASFELPAREPGGSPRAYTVVVHEV